MSRETSRLKENKLTQLLLVSIFGFGIVITFLSSLSIKPNLTNLYFYALLLIALALLYKPFGVFFFSLLNRLFKSIVFTLKKLPLRKNISSTKIDELSCLEIVRYLRSLFEKYGYETELTKDSNEFSSYLIIKKGPQKYIIQTKRKENKIGVKAIHEILWEVRNYEANGAIIITNQYFTSSAKKLANTKDIQLVDRDELITMLKTSNKKYRFATALSLILHR